MGKRNLVKVEWDVDANSDEYCTVEITFSIGDESLKTSIRLYNERFRTLYCTDKDFWFVLRYLIGDTLEKEREDGDISMERLKEIMNDTDQFFSENWGEWLHDFAWLSHYGNKPDEPWIKEFVVKVREEYKEDNPNLVGYF